MLLGRFPRLVAKEGECDENRRLESGQLSYKLAAFTTTQLSKPSESKEAFILKSSQREISHTILSRLRLCHVSSQLSEIA